jgi:hypothetical protein
MTAVTLWQQASESMELGTNLFEQNQYSKYDDYAGASRF